MAPAPPSSALERLADRTAHYAAGLYRPRGTSRVPLGDDHAVEGEARGLAASVHPADVDAEASAIRAAATERALRDALWQPRGEQMVDVDANGQPIPYIRSRNR